MSKYSQKTKDQALYLFKIGFGIHSVVNQLNMVSPNYNSIA